MLSHRMIYHHNHKNDYAHDDGVVMMMTMSMIMNDNDKDDDDDSA